MDFEGVKYMRLLRVSDGEQLAYATSIKSRQHGPCADGRLGLGM